MTDGFQDGDLLPDGLVLSLKGGYPCAVYRCGCGREQTAECETFGGGISASAARSLGWQMLNGWICPFCSGQTHKLTQVFKGGLT